jgi:16S rRNA (adenine(1408)-N(1))-methyltransferase
VAAPSDNSTETNLSGLLPRTGGGIVIDLGTGDGRFVSAAAKKHPDKFFIGIDANVKPLEKPSMKATRKPAKGGLPNALFVQASIEDLPPELNGVADEIHIHFPWGSLLRAVAKGDPRALGSLYRIGSPACILEVIIGFDPTRDASEIERLGLDPLTSEFIRSTLTPRYASAGFAHVESRTLSPDAWSRIETSWARRLAGSTTREVTYLLFRRA